MGQARALVAVGSGVSTGTAQDSPCFLPVTLSSPGWEDDSSLRVKEAFQSCFCQRTGIQELLSHTLT